MQTVYFDQTFCAPFQFGFQKWHISLSYWCKYKCLRDPQKEIQMLGLADCSLSCHLHFSLAVTTDFSKLAWLAFTFLVFNHDKHVQFVCKKIYLQCLYLVPISLNLHKFCFIIDSLQEYTMYVPVDTISFSPLLPAAVEILNFNHV